MNATTPAPLARDAYCPHCGYNLRGLSGERCPECGKASLPSELAASLIPWTRRKTVGRVKMFLRTIHLVTFHSRQVVPFGSVELDRSEARRFRWLCTLLLVGMILPWMLVADLKDAPGRVYEALIGPVGTNPLPWPGQLVAIWNVSATLWPIRVLFSLAAARFIAVFPARLASFPCYPEAQREHLITAAHYLVGAFVGGAIAGAAASVPLIGTLWAMYNAKPPHEQMIALMPVLAAIFAPLTCLYSMHRFFRQADLVTQKRSLYLAALGPTIVLLWLFVWIVLVPLCVGLLITIVRYH